MKRRIWTVAVALASVAALVAVPAALRGVHDSEARGTASGHVDDGQGDADPNDDPTASVRIFVPTGTSLTTTQAPGTIARPGPRDRQGARPRRRRPAARGQSGRRRTRPDRARHAGRMPRHRDAARILGDGAQRRGADPARSRYLVATTGAQAALGPAYIQVCLPPPDLPVGHARSGDVRRQARTAPSSRSTGVFSASPGAGSRSGRHTDRASARSTWPERSPHPPRSRPARSRSQRGSPVRRASEPS